MPTYGYVETSGTQSIPGFDCKLGIGTSSGTSSSLDADDDLVRITQVVRAIHGDEAGLADETIVVRLEAVMGVCIQRQGDGQIVEDVSDLVQR